MKKRKKKKVTLNQIKRARKAAREVVGKVPGIRVHKSKKSYNRKKERRVDF